MFFGISVNCIISEIPFFQLFIANMLEWHLFLHINFVSSELSSLTSSSFYFEDSLVFSILKYISSTDKVLLLNL